MVKKCKCLKVTKYWVDNVKFIFQASPVAIFRKQAPEIEQNVEKEIPNEVINLRKQI